MRALDGGDIVDVDYWGSMYILIHLQWDLGRGFLFVLAGFTKEDRTECFRSVGITRPPIVLENGIRSSVSVREDSIRRSRSHPGLVSISMPTRVIILVYWYTL